MEEKDIRLYGVEHPSLIERRNPSGAIFTYKRSNEEDGIRPLVEQIAKINGGALVVFIRNRVLAYECGKQLGEKYPAKTSIVWTESLTEEVVDERLGEFNDGKAEVLICTDDAWLQREKLTRDIDLIISFQPIVTDRHRKERECIFGERKRRHIHLSPN